MQIEDSLQSLIWSISLLINHNRTTMLQNTSLCILFCQLSYILARMAFKSEMTFLSRNGFSARNVFFAWNGFFGRNFFAAKNTFVKFEVAFWTKMAFWLEMTYFSKYWKVWLAFNGWKLSGLLIKESYKI